MRDRKFIKSIERGLMVLAKVGASSTPSTLTQIADACGMNRTATLRFLYTLTELGYLQRVDKKYTAGTRAITLSINSLNNLSLKSIAKPYLDEFSMKFNVTINLQILDADSGQIILIYRREISRFLKHDLEIGSKLPMNCTAGGKVMLAYLPDDKLRQLLANLEYVSLTPNSITSQKKLFEEIQLVRKKGYASTREELALGHFSYAVPIFNSSNEILGAIAINFKESMLSDTEMLEDLIATGRTLSENLEYKAGYPRVFNQE